MNSSQANKPSWSGKLYSEGWVDAHGGVVAVVDPADGKEIASVGLADAVDVDRAAKSAKKAQKAWAKLPFAQRSAIIRKAAELLQERQLEFADWNVRESGGIRPKALWETSFTYEQMHQAAGLAYLPDGEVYPSLVPGRMNFSERAPVGVVGVISPWNFPLILSMRSIAPALVLGNAVILKPDAQTPISGGLLIAEIFAAAGLPEGVFHVLPGGAPAGEAMVEHPLVDMISFTGSTAVGRRIGAKCGEALKKVVLELGGNNVHIVLEDADLDGAVACASWGTFLHQGQICMAAGRHLVHRKLAQQYAEKLTERARSLVVGDPKTDRVHLGPLINDKQVARIHELVQTAIREGAKLLTGGTFEQRFYQPTVLMDVTPNMEVFKAEIFGPVAPITVFDTPEEAVALANASEYGLAASIHTKDVMAGIELAKELKTGMVHVNDQPVNCEPHVPFGGMGASGAGGHFGGLMSIDLFTQVQWISAVRKPAQYPF